MSTDIEQLIEEASRAEGLPVAYDLLGMVTRLADALEREHRKSENAIARVLAVAVERDAAVQRAYESEADAKRRLVNLETTVAERDQARKRAERAERAIRWANELLGWFPNNGADRILSAALEAESDTLSAVRTDQGGHHD